MKRLLLLALLVPAVACASARAHTPPEEHPALLVPPAPPRVIEPLPAEPQPIEPVADLPNTAPANPPRPRPQREPNRPAGTENKPEAKPADPVADPAAQPPATQPVPPLRTPGDPDGPEMVRQINGTLERANKALDNINYQALSGDRRANYDNARSYIKQAEDALKANNLISAKSLAERAETIARALAGG